MSGIINRIIKVDNIETVFDKTFEIVNEIIILQNNVSIYLYNKYMKSYKVDNTSIKYNITSKYKNLY